LAWEGREIRAMLEEQNRPEWIADLLPRALWPITAFIKELDQQSDYGTREELDRLLQFLVPIMDTVEENLAVLDLILQESLGRIMVKTTGSFRLFGSFRRKDFGKAYIEQPQAPGKVIPKFSDELKLDPITADNLKNDVEALDVVREALLAQAGVIAERIEGTCHDLGLELPASIKAKIGQGGES